MPPLPKTICCRSSKVRGRAPILLPLTLLVLTGCAATPRVEPPITLRCPAPAALPAALSLIDSNDTTPSLKMADEWLRSLEQTLSVETTK